MSSVLETALEHVFRYEGGFVDHPDDPGGRTNKGITQKTYNAWRKQIGQPSADVKTISEEEAREIYVVNYWNVVRGDDLPPALAVLMMDVAVNSGPGQAVKTLQRALNSGGAKLRVDGDLGPNTLAAVRAANLERLLDEFVVRRGVFYGGLKTFTTFGLGWARRLVAGARLAHSLLGEGRNGGNGADATAPQAPTELRRYFHDDLGVQIYGSFFRVWEGWATAASVLDGMKQTPPPFAGGAPTPRIEGLDAALIGARLPETAPAPPRLGQQVVAMGFPAGSATATHRTGEVVARRADGKVWLARIVAPDEPVVEGMAGGVVFDPGQGLPLGILVNPQARIDLDQDGVPDQSFEFIALSDVFEALKPVMAATA